MINNTIKNLVREETYTPGLLLSLQPVYNRNLDTAAYELLLEERPDGSDDSKTDQICQLVLGTYGSIIVPDGQKLIPVFLLISNEVVLNAENFDAPHTHYILEIPEKVELTPEYVEGLQKLSAKGYRLAISGYFENKERYQPLLNIAHIIKIDLISHPIETLQSDINQLRSFGLDLLASNVQTKQQFTHLQQKGFAFFTGQFQKQPVESKGKRLSSNKLVLLELLSELKNPNTSINKLQDIAIKDPNLTYKLLKIINSAAFGLSRQIDSISHAINMLGMEQLGRWVSMFLLDGSKSTDADLMRNMLVRGRMCEILAELADREKPISHFISGLLSQLDILMEIPMLQLMEEVPLSVDIKNALIERSGSIGEILSEVELYEAGQFALLKGIVDKEFYEVAYRHSVAWAQHVLSAMSN